MAELIGLKLIACVPLGLGMILRFKTPGFGFPVCRKTGKNRIWFAGKPVKTGLSSIYNINILNQCVIYHFQCFDDGELIFDIGFIKFRSLSGWIQQ